MGERPPMNQLAGIWLIGGIFLGSAVGALVGVLGDQIVAFTGAGIVLGVIIGVLGELRAARQRSTSRK